LLKFILKAKKAVLGIGKKRKIYAWREGKRIIPILL
jgi:hypothetical protein